MPYCADFETTSETNLETDGYVRVWLWSLVDCDTMEEYWGTTLDDFIKKIKSLKCDIIFFHNLRFDGQFLVHYFVQNKWIYGTDYDCIIDKMNIWYQIQIYNVKRKIKIWDSSKKYPGLSVQGIAELYGIEGKKEKPYFDMYRPEGYQPTEEEIEYCLQDSRIIAHTIKIDFEHGYKGMTLSSDSFKEVKETIGGYKGYRKYMPELNKEFDSFIRRSYKGGWVYCNPRYQGLELDNVNVYDVNSLYPYVMYNKPLPVGKPFVRTPRPGELYVVRFTTEFKLKEGYLPTIQIKNSMRYIETDYLTESCGPTELTLTNIDYELFKEHYDIDYEIKHTYVCFKSMVGLLKEYIDRWIAEKYKAVDKHQQDRKYIAKRRLNSPYGKTGMRGDRINKIPEEYEGDTLVYRPELVEGQTIYVPYASFVCAWARYITITTAQQNYENFVYADTDSVHIIGEPYGDMWVDSKELGAWKHEGHFEKGKYLRAKTYIHGHYRITEDSGSSDAAERYRIGLCKDEIRKDCTAEESTANGEIQIDEVKCAGMPDSIKKKVKWDDFVIGHEFYDLDKGIYKVQQKTVKGGCILVKLPFKIREKLMS